MNDRVSEELLAEAAQQNMSELISKIDVPALNFLDFIQAVDGRLTTDSTMIAALFGKRHDNVLRDIRAMMSLLPDDRLLNFEETVTARPNPSGGADIETVSYRVTQDGFTLLGMGFTGKRALAFKLAYIDAFNAMAGYIKNQRDGLRFRCMELELEDKDSKRRGSHHAKGLNQRKREKKVIDPELAELKDKVQPKLV